MWIRKIGGLRVKVGFGMSGGIASDSRKTFDKSIRHVRTDCSQHTVNAPAQFSK